MKLINNSRRNNVLFSKNYSYANFFDPSTMLDPDTLQLLQDQALDYAKQNNLPVQYEFDRFNNYLDSGAVGNVRKILGKGVDAAGNLANKAANKLTDIQLAEKDAIGNKLNELGQGITNRARGFIGNAQDMYQDMRQGNTGGDFPQELPVPSILANSDATTPNVDYLHNTQDGMLGINPGNPAPENSVGLSVPGLAGGAIGYGLTRQAMQRKKNIPQQVSMSAPGYMAIFAFSAKPILNTTIKKKAVNAFNRKMGRIAKSGDLASTNPEIRNTAIGNVAKIKERIRQA